MLSRAFAVGIWATLPACSGDATAVLARVYPAQVAVSDASLPPSDASLPPSDASLPPSDAAAAGPWPAAMTWALYAETGGYAEWVNPPTGASATVTARSPQNIRAGMAFEFSGGAMLDLAQYDQVELTMDVTEGDTFELFLGRGPDVGCSYVFARDQSNKYTTTLSQPAWCVPSQCGFDLKVTGGLILAYVPADSRLTATVSGIRFISSSPGARSGSASALGGAKGPGGFCWFLVNWDRTASVSWVPGNPTSSSVHVLGTTTTNGIVGMAFEVPQGYRLSQYRTLVMDATVSSGSTQGTSSVLVQAVKLSQGRGWVIPGDGVRQTYRIDLTQPGYSFGSSLSLDDVARIEFVPQANGGVATIDALVQKIELQP